MSATDTNQEFNSDLDDWWGQLWGNRICAASPKEKSKMIFIAFVKKNCQESGSYRLTDNDISNLFSEFIDHISDW